MDGDGDGLADFEPISNPVITKAPDDKKKICLLSKQMKLFQ